MCKYAHSTLQMSFVKQTMNVIDILAIAPYYISLVFEDPNIGLPADEELQQTAAANTTVTETEVEMISHTFNMSIPAILSQDTASGGGFGNVSRILQVLRIARVMRIFKLARRSIGLQAMAHTMRKSYKQVAAVTMIMMIVEIMINDQLCLLLLFVFMGMLIFGSLCYFAEKDLDSGYTR